MIEIRNNTKNIIDLKLIKKTIELFLIHHKIKNKNISIAFVADKTIQKLNKDYRKKDKTTDVLSFCGEGDELGEIVINYAQIKKQAKKYSNSDEEELVFILVHGLLHLIGYTDDTDKEALIMERLGQKFINKITNCTNLLRIK